MYYTTLQVFLLLVYPLDGASFYWQRTGFHAIFCTFSKVFFPPL
jgi:hypothetical protein